MKNNTRIYWPKGIFQTDLTQKKIEFAWDIHETLARKKKSECAAITLRYSSLLLRNAQLLRNGIKTIAKKEEYIAAEAYAHYFEQQQQAQIARYIKEVANAYVPIKGITELLKQLSSKGYTHRLASNIGRAYLPIIINRFAIHYHNKLFAYMEGGTIVDYGIETRNTTVDGIIGSVQYVFECKPKNALFQAHNQRYNPDHASIIVFVDDKQKNVEAACNNGWIGIHFKSIKKLRSDLAKLGIIP